MCACRAAMSGNPVYDAVQRGDVAGARQCLGSSVNEGVGSGQRTPLHVACQAGHLEMVQLLVEQGSATLDLKDKSGWFAIHHAANAGSAAVVLYLINKGADVNLKTGNLQAQTPLHMCVAEGKYDCAKVLLQRGADVNARDRQKRTPLYKAARWGKADIMALLLAYGAEITPDLQEAVEMGTGSRNSKHELLTILQEDLPEERRNALREPLDEDAILRGAVAPSSGGAGAGKASSSGAPKSKPPPEKHSLEEDRTGSLGGRAAPAASTQAPAAAASGNLQPVPLGQRDLVPPPSQQNPKESGSCVLL